ncbi:MAG: SAM-dependent DNA methyltransferase, partial [Candidatus Pacebacteria bacterium]|nr:SAM-dependent DNA methyltransferase [Candidatus Paceibacterota bacterium]
GKVQLINANQMFEKRRKSLGSKRNDIPRSAIDEITRLYGEFKESPISKIFANEEFGYRKITVERPLLDEAGKPVLKKGKMQADASLRDTESVPLGEDVDAYMTREVLPFAPGAWVDESKTKIGYEIPFTRFFYTYEAPRSSEKIKAEILALEKELDGSLAEIFR